MSKVSKINVIFYLLLILHFACIFSELATLWVVLVVPELSEGGYKGYFASRKLIMA